MLGLRLGDAKILRSPGGRVSTSVLTGCVLSVQLLQVDRIMIVPHTRCAMAVGHRRRHPQGDRRAKTGDRHHLDLVRRQPRPDGTAPGRTSTWCTNHPLIKGQAEVGGFMYDVDTGLLTRSSESPGAGEQHPVGSSDVRLAQVGGRCPVAGAERPVNARMLRE